MHLEKKCEFPFKGGLCWEVILCFVVSGVMLKILDWCQWNWENTNVLSEIGKNKLWLHFKTHQRFYDLYTQKLELQTSLILLMLNPDISCLENSVDPDHHNVKVDYNRLWVFNFSMNLTNKKKVLLRIWIWEFFIHHCRLGKKHTFFSDFVTCTSCIFCT